MRRGWHAAPAADLRTALCAWRGLGVAGAARRLPPPVPPADQHAELPEWLDYHRRLGVSHVYVMDDASQPPLGEVLAPYIEVRGGAGAGSSQGRPPRHVQRAASCPARGKHASWAGLGCAACAAAPAMLGRHLALAPRVCVCVCAGGVGHAPLPGGLCRHPAGVERHDLPRSPGPPPPDDDVCPLPPRLRRKAPVDGCGERGGLLWCA